MVSALAFGSKGQWLESCWSEFISLSDFAYQIQIGEMKIGHCPLNLKNYAAATRYWDINGMVFPLAANHMIPT